MRRYIFIIAVFILTCNVTTVYAAPKTQTMVHLLDYIGRDYQMAVKNGKIINEDEFAEMQEFGRTVKNMINSGINDDKSYKSSLLDSTKRLQKLINSKDAREKVAALSKNIRNTLILETNYKVTPTQMPSISDGKELYKQECMECHGENGRGDGFASHGLKPPPTNFHDDDLMKQVSPFQAYNTIRLGLDGTAMEPFPKLSDQEVWDLAFYIKTFRFKESGLKNSDIQALADSASVSLEDIATSSDTKLLSLLNGTAKEKQNKLAAIRLQKADKGSANSLELATQYLKAVLPGYKSGDHDIARTNALAAYLEGVEPVEAQLRANDPAFVRDLEAQMMSLRNSIENKEDYAKVKEKTEASLNMVSQAYKMMQDSKLTYWLSYMLSGSIMLREGLEAFLIIAVIIAIIRKTKIKRAMKWLNSGWITALFLGIIGWFFSDSIRAINGQNREIMEGVIALLAVAVLTFVGFWLHSNSHAKKWKKFIEERVHKLLRAENMFGLAVFGFIVVFREAFESVLFLRAISLETSDANQSAIGLGALSAFVIIAGIAVLFLKYSVKLPLRQLFRYSAWMITLLAVILIGKGIHSIQEAGMFTVTEFPINIRLDWIGLYPTMETILAQVLLLVVVTGVWYLTERKMKTA